MDILPNNDNRVMLIVWGILGLVGGVVRACEEDNRRHHNARRVISSLLTSVFVGMLAGSFLHTSFTDPTTLGGMCAMAGYFGQLSLVLFIKWGRRKVGLDRDDDNPNNKKEDKK